jgi:hypothetical protein
MASFLPREAHEVPAEVLDRLSSGEPVSRVESGEVGQVMIYADESRQVLVRDEGGPGWLDEIRRRAADIDEGRADLIDGDVVFRAMRARIAAGRK